MKYSHDMESIADAEYYGFEPGCSRDMKPVFPGMSRRGFVTGLVLGAASLPGAASAASQLYCPPNVQAFMRGGSGSGFTSSDGALQSPVDQDYSGAIPDDGPGLRRLVIRRTQTGEVFDYEFVQNGSYNPSALTAWNRFCRDSDGGVGNMDPGTLDLIWDIWKRLGSDEPLSINSAYRSPAYNRKVGGAPNSMHMHGKALDVNSSRFAPRQVHAAAKSSPKTGGLGSYSSFTHVDVGAKRFWNG